MKNSFPLFALAAFLLLPLFALLQSFDVHLYRAFHVVPVLIAYFIGGMVATLLSDYLPRHGPRIRAHRSWLTDWLPHS